MRRPEHRINIKMNVYRLFGRERRTSRATTYQKKTFRLQHSTAATS